jgi:hypothetical protein
VTYRILIIVPDTSLDTREEIINASSGFEPTILSGTVTRQRALKEIMTGNWDIVYFGTHGKEYVLEMSDGMIEEDLLEHAVKTNGRIKMLFLNACRSIHTSAEVYNNSNVAYTVGWPGNVTNEVARTWARLFFESLRIDSMDVRGAAKIASDAIVKSYRICPDELPIVLNGRASVLIAENFQLNAELHRSGVVRMPTWMVASNILLIVLLLLILTLLALAH